MFVQVRCEENAETHNFQPVWNSSGAVLTGCKWIFSDVHVQPFTLV